jgi:hypothetical protein
MALPRFSLLAVLLVFHLARWLAVCCYVSVSIFGKHGLALLNSTVHAGCIGLHCAGTGLYRVFGVLTMPVACSSCYSQLMAASDCPLAIVLVCC